MSPTAGGVAFDIASPIGAIAAANSGSKVKDMTGPFEGCCRLQIRRSGVGRKDDDLARESPGSGPGMDRSQVCQRDTLGNVDVQLAAVDARDEFRQLHGVAADEEVDGSNSARLVARGGHPHGGAHRNAAVANQGGQRCELVGGDRCEVEQDIDRLGDRADHYATADDGAQITVRWYVKGGADSSAPDPAVLFFHGGG